MHVNHSGPAKITVVAQSGAGVVICPRTEANLGDGLGDLPRRLVAQAPIAIGSDSPVDRCWREELRGLDYGQRLAQHRRNLRAAPSCDPPATAQRLFSRALQAGSAACGGAAWGLLVGGRADALVVDPGNPDNPTTLGIPPERWLDAQLFSSPARPWLQELHPETRARVVGQSQELTPAMKQSAVIALCMRQAIAQVVAQELGVSRGSLYKWKKSIARPRRIRTHESPARRPGKP